LQDSVGKLREGQMGRTVSGALALLFVGSSALRKGSRVRGTPGMVDEMYLYGAPSVAKPALTNFSGCFAGKRVVNIDHTRGGRFIYDRVVGVARTLGYYNAMMDLQEIDVKGARKTDDMEDIDPSKFPYSVKTTKCGADTPRLPEGGAFSRTFDLHWEQLYTETVENSVLTKFEKDMGFFAEKCAFNRDEKTVKGWVESRGWKLVASSTHEGGKVVQGRQVVHLIQHPSTLDCVITFQGSSSIKDWIANFGALRTKFCGRPEGFHDGIAWATELSVTSDQYQAKIAPKLPKCRRVIAVGQSQGAGQAEMFTACVNQNRPTGKGSELFDKVTWVKGSPGKLPYL